MVDVISLLPLLRGWRWAAKDVDLPEVITTKKEVFRATDEKGWMLWAVGYVNNKNTSIQVIVDGYSTTDVTPNDLYGAGLIMPNPTGFWVGIYNEILNLYSVIFSPPYSSGYTRSLVIGFIPPIGETVTLVKYAHLLVRIDDEIEFRKSLKELGM